MTNEERELMLDLLCDKFVYGLSEEDARKLESLGYDPQEAEAIELTVAALTAAGEELQAPMPKSLHDRIYASAMDIVGESGRDAEAEPVIEPPREIVLSGGRSPWFGWLGWAVAAAACITLAVTLFSRPDSKQANLPPVPTPTPEERLTPAQQRQKLIESPGELVRADWGPGKMQDVNVSGDVVWSEDKQVGYMRLKGLPKNDPNNETYQLWIVDAAQDPKTPIDGGVFDVTADGEVVIPIDAKIKVRDPKAFAITIERPGGVVVSKQERLPALAPVKPSST